MQVDSLGGAASHSEDPIGPFMRPDDLKECRRLHRKHGSTYYFATRWLPARYRDRVHALYGFVRVPDEWVDNPLQKDNSVISRNLREYRNELLRGVEGVPPMSAVLRAFCDLMHQTTMPINEPLLFLNAMEADLTVTRYQTYADLRGYMRGSASAVGVMMVYAVDCGRQPHLLEPAMKLGEAMQLTNFLRDVGEDVRRGRIYLPLEDLESFGVLEQDILESRKTEAFVALMKFQIARARALYAASDRGIAELPGRVRLAVKLARILYSRILDRIENSDFDVFSRRARTSRLEKGLVAIQVLCGWL